MRPQTTEQQIWNLEVGHGPLIAAAIHDGHAMRKEVETISALDGAARLREEDPHTGIWTSIAESRIIGTHSRFEVDLNRPREKAVYLKPEDAWGLEVWKHEPPQMLVIRSLEAYDAFYAKVHETLTQLQARFGFLLVLDLHSYNHRRGGPNAPVTDPQANPEVNIGTGTMPRSRWAPLADRFMQDLAQFDFLGKHLDVRENVKFRGGQFSRWIHEQFPDSACALAVEFKKFFMDEWTGEPDFVQVEAIQQALLSTIPGILEELDRLSG